LTSVSGCDSFVNLTLAVKQTASSSYSQSICSNETYNFNGHTLNTAGTYADTLTSITGCDSFVAFTLTLMPVDTPSSSQSICQGQTYNFNGRSLSNSGTYYDSLTALTGCDSIIILRLNVLSNPAAPSVTQHGNTLTSSAAQSYQWYLNGTLLAGDTLQSIIITQSGEYKVEVTGENGCESPSATYSAELNGIEQLSGGIDMKLYPNPNDGSFTVVFTDNQPREINITDAIGNSIINGDKISGQKVYHLNSLPNGIYFLQVKMNEQVNTMKFVVGR
jgi:hypothetical protein